MWSRSIAVLTLSVIVGLSVSARSDDVAVAVAPAPVLIEHGEARRFVNCDFTITNHSRDTLTLVEILLTVRDARGTTVMQKLVNENGMIPSIETVPNRAIAPGGTTTVFNPMHDFPEALPLDTLVFAFRLRGPSRGKASGAERVTEVRVAPREYRAKTVLRLPLDGPLLNYDDHDFYSHHRRLNLGNPLIKQLGVAGNSGRYAFDLSIVDERGRMFRGDGTRNEDWYSWNQPVHAVGDGRVVSAANDRPDYEIGKTRFEPPSMPFDPMLFSGNHVVIDHGNGEYSLLAHMRRGSVTVRKGDTVRRGQVVGRVGFSGSVITVHTHYQLQRGADFGSEGLPAEFVDFERVRGAATTRVARGTVDTGEIVRQLTTSR